MLVQLPYGGNQDLPLECPATVDVIDWSRPGTTSSVDPAAATRAAIQDPLGVATLINLVVRGDRIVLPVEPGLPAAEAIVASIIGTLVDAGHVPADLTVLWSAAAENHPPPSAAVDPAYRQEVNFVRHDPDEGSQLAYLAAARDASPIYLNRIVCDADFVLPVGLLRTRRALGYLGLFGGLFPAFSGRDTQQRLRPVIGKSRLARQRKLRELADEVAWLLGIQFTVQAVPGQDDTVLAILAGAIEAVRTAGRQMCDQAWHHALPQTVSLVVAAIDGGPDQQTWDNVARALLAATRAVTDQGAIALVTQLDARPGSALRRFGRWTDDQPLPSVRRIEAEPDAVVAQLLLAARQRARLYMLSRLSRATVESLGAIHIDDPQDIERLIARHPSCLILGGAQHATISLEQLEPAP